VLLMGRSVPYSPCSSFSVKYIAYVSGMSQYGNVYRCEPYGMLAHVQPREGRSIETGRPIPFHSMQGGRGEGACG
jgi:hypothetical protein